MTRAKIEIYNSPLESEPIKTLDTIEELEAYAKDNGTQADCVSVNDMELMGWDELYDFV